MHSQSVPYSVSEADGHKKLDPFHVWEFSFHLTCTRYLSNTSKGSGAAVDGNSNGVVGRNALTKSCLMERGVCLDTRRVAAHATSGDAFSRGTLLAVMSLQVLVADISETHGTASCGLQNQNAAQPHPRIESPLVSDVLIRTPLTWGTGARGGG